MEESDSERIRRKKYIDEKIKLGQYTEANYKELSNLGIFDLIIEKIKDQGSAEFDNKIFISEKGVLFEILEVPNEQEKNSSFALKSKEEGSEFSSALHQAIKNDISEGVKMIGKIYEISENSIMNKGQTNQHINSQQLLYKENIEEAIRLLDSNPNLESVFIPYKEQNIHTDKEKKTEITEEKATEIALKIYNILHSEQQKDSDLIKENQILLLALTYNITQDSQLELIIEKYLEYVELESDPTIDEYENIDKIYNIFKPIINSQIVSSKNKLKDHKNEKKHDVISNSEGKQSEISNLEGKQSEIPNSEGKQDIISNSEGKQDIISDLNETSDYM
ncbi:MAG: hypothetical protein U1E31_01705 [Rickettsiales bacterium]